MSLTRRALIQATASAAVTSVDAGLARQGRSDCIRSYFDTVMAYVRLLIASIAAASATSYAEVSAAEDDATLLKQANKIFRPLPKNMGTQDFPVTNDRVELGRMLFFDPRLTIEANMSCASCHQPALYGTDGLPKAIGIKQRPHPRNTPTNLNSQLGTLPIQWRGDRESVEDQVMKGLVSPITGGFPDLQAALDRIDRIPGYAPLFKAAFPEEANPLTAQNVAKAIGAYERTFVTPAPFDAYLAGNVNALSPTAREGLGKFINTGCVACHNGVGVGGGMYAKFGVLEDYWTATGSKEIDKGRIEVTKNADDLYVFRVAGLRNVAMTAPYFHDGSVATLPEAVKIMARVQLGVTLGDADRDAIVAFLESLTGELPIEFATSPILPPSGPALSR